MSEGIPNYWLIPSNQNQYDAIGAFKKFKTIDWGNGQKNTIKSGDIVYLYSSKPIQAIVLKAKVIKADFTSDELLDGVDSEFEKRIDPKMPETYFRLELLKFTNQQLLSSKTLHQYGLSGNVQGKRTINGDLLQYILNNEDYGENKMKQPLNQILYGPPGTGKTYNTINKALEILDGDIPEKREDAKKKFEEYKKAGQIEFVTFHQSYGYEEFVEGIKAKSQNGSLEYNVEDGVFKKISSKALKNYEDSEKDSNLLKSEYENTKYLEEFINSAIESEEDFIKTKGGKFKIESFEDDTINVATDDSRYSSNRLKLKFDELLKVVNYPSKLESSKQLSKEVFGIENQKQIFTYYFTLLKKFKEYPTKEIKEIKDKEKVELKYFILIIDEINRGNISKIFGELITLIEPSKRIGAEEAITLKLPYSGDEFGVPQNLYIIGTMNTADRSIALMDTALRRRFDFTEMMPDLETLNEFEYIEGINIKSLLETINKRIEYLYDRDHTIGHAYFISLKDKNGDEVKAELDNIFRNKIIPLLQEYFYDDWEKIQIVLGDHPEQFKKKEISKNFNQYQFIQSEKIKEEEVLGLDHPDIENNGVEYKINSIFKHEAYLKIYGEYPKLKTDENEEQTNTFN